MKPQIDYDRAVLADMLSSIFSDHEWDDSVQDTAGRVLRYWKEFAEPNTERPPFEFTAFEAKGTGIVLVKDIEFTSICSHHLLPFYGKAHVAYLPDKLMVGLSKIPRLVQWRAKRPQVQEGLTRQIACQLDKELQTKGAACIIEARHTCLACRGARSGGAYMVTSELTGVFLESDRARAELYALMRLEGPS